MTSKIVVNNIQTDAGISSVTLLSHIAGHDSTQNVSGINSVTANAFYGDGSNLTGAGPTLTNGADNRVVTATGANALNAETGVVITSDSELIVGMTAGSGSSPDARLQVRGDTFAKAQIQVLSTHNDDNPASLQISKSRSSGNTILGDNDDIGQINFGGNDGNGYHNVGRIMVSSSGEGNGNDDLPTVMKFFTTANGSASLTERLRIHSNGSVTKPTNPSFRATASSSLDYTSDNTLAFQNEKHDVGGNYNTSNSYYTIPTTGYYKFEVMHFAQPGQIARVQLERSTDSGSSWSTIQIGPRIESSGGGRYIAGWMHVFHEFTATNLVRVRWSQGNVHINNGYGWFQGWLVQ